MISKPINLINAKLEEMYDDAMFWFYTTIQAIRLVYMLYNCLCFTSAVKT